jgi:tetratricopeptide (TPR) repeat protein
MHAHEIERWRAADAVFDRLLDLPRAERGAALAALALAPELHAEVLRLLAGDTEQASALDRRDGLEMPASVAMDGLAGRSLGRWTLEHEIGRGGMAVVYRAHDTQRPQQLAAVKLLTWAAAATGVERFRREQSILARLNHPHIAPLFDAGAAADGTLWLAMALVEGEPIDQWCERQRLDLRARVRLLLDVCEAVAYAHRNLVVHRDIKPSNVLVDREGHVRLLDFGIARLTDDTLGDATATHWRALSPMYAAPEQFSGAVPSTAMDVFGLGALLYALLTGVAPRAGADHRVPIVAPSRASRVLASASALPPAAALRGDLDAVLLKALADDPAARYGNVEGLADDLRRWLAAAPVRARAPAWSYRAGRALRRHWLPVSLAAVAIASLALGALVALERAREAQQQAQNADAARAQALAALARATALRDFLLTVFQAQAPGRPRSELPSTAELLDEGEALALNAGGDEPSVRADMLDAITQVRLARGDGARAQALIARSLELADDTTEGGAAMRARALLRQAQVQQQQRLGEPVLQSLREAQVLLAGDTDSELAIEVELARANALLEQRRFDAALAALEPLGRLASANGDLSATLRDRVFSAQAVALASLGRHRESQAYRELGLQTTRQLYGPRHLRVAVALANLGSGDGRLGEPARGEQRLLEALSIYDDVFDRPSEYRGSARLGLGWLLLARGRFDEALAAFARGNAEIAQVRGIARVEDYDFHHWNRGIALAVAGRWADAIDALQQAQRGLSQRPATFAGPRATAAAWLAIAQCARGEASAGTMALGVMRDHRAQVARMAPEDESLYDEAQISCALARGDATTAAALLAPMLARDAGLERGFADEIARRQSLAARAAVARGDTAAARREALAARATLRAAGLEQHPLNAQIAPLLAPGG